MTAPSRVSAEEQNLHSLLDQLALLIDELSAQKALVSRVPEAVIVAVPYPGAKSIKDRYAHFLNRERHLNMPVIEGLVDGTLVGEEVTESAMLSERQDISGLSMLEIMEQLSTSRANVLKQLDKADDEVWTRVVLIDGKQVDMKTWAFRMAIQDADDLREIGVQFSEQQLSFTGND